MNAATRRRLSLWLFLGFFCLAPGAWGACGDGILDPEEECDDGNTVSCDGCEENCTLPACGNGIACPPEACDDGNTKNGDGCSATCTLGSKCTGVKIQAAGKLAACLLGLEAKEAATAKPKDEKKVVACRQKLTAALAKADAKGRDCHGTNDDTEADIDAFIATVQAEIGSPSGSPSKCDGKKLKAVAKEAQCVLASKTQLSAKGKPVDPAKIDKCKAKLAAAFASASADGNCGSGGPGGSAAIDAEIAVMADILYVKFWPVPIPYARSPYVENPSTHLPAAFRAGTGGYDGHFISEDHPTMYLQHAGNYGDKPGCPSCLVHDGDEGTDQCTATGVCSSVPVSGAENLCCRQVSSGNCIDNSPPSNCLQDPYGNVTQAGINEADIYYGKISQGLFGNLSQQYDGTPGTGPQNLQEWMTVFGFDNTAAGDCTKPTPIESITDWALRCGCVSYFNKMELELGRFLCCTTFPDLNDDASFAGNGVACMVGNFGKDFNQVKGGLEGSLGFKDNQNTVCVTTRPSRPPHFRTQWWAFNGVTLTQNKFGVWSYGPAASSGCPNCPGPRLNDVLLDRARHRPIPLACANCHGGVYAPNDTCVPEPSTHGGTLHGVRGDADCGQIPGSCVDDDDTAQPCSSSSTGCHCKDAHMIADSKFLPLNPWTLIFPGDPGAYIPSLPPTQTRAGQMMRVHDINQLAANWPIDGVTYPGNNHTGGPGSDMLTGIQLEWLQKLYPSGPTPASDTAPSGWTGSDTQRDLWNKVVLPACANCHMTIGAQPVGTCGTSCGANNDTPFAIDTYDDFVAFDTHGAICKREFHMPHAAPTQEWFWSKQPFITIRGPSTSTAIYTTPREAFFGAILQQETKCCGPSFYGSSTKHCSLTHNSSVDPFAPVDANCDCPLDVPLHPDQVELPEPLPPFAPFLFKKAYDGDGCAVTEVFTKPGGGLASRLNFEPSDNYCGLPKDILQTTGTTIPNTKGTDGLICDNSVVRQGICVPGCRLADPRTGNINLTAPFRACPKEFECRADNRCHVCGSIGEFLCTTGQLGVGPCPISGSPSGSKCI